MNDLTPRRVLALTTAATVLCVPAAAAGGPEAHASKRCKPIATGNGGKARFISTSGPGLSCRTARLVARRARGRRYAARGFTCKRNGPYRRSTGQLYGCNRLSRGRVQGIGFFYYRP